MYTRGHQTFTLTEVMIAAVILALAAVATLGIVGGAQSAVVQSEKRWFDQHAVTEATEYFLLAGPRSSVPSDVLPGGYSATCTLLYVDDVHEDAQEAIDSWLLGEYHIQVFDQGGNLAGECRVRKVLQEEDFE